MFTGNEAMLHENLFARGLPAECSAIARSPSLETIALCALR